MRIYLKTMTFCVIGLSALNGSAQKISYAEDPASGNIISLRINDDEHNMNWLINTDGSQYEWIGDKYQWGTVYFEAKEGTVETNVDRRHEGDDIVETYTFKNVSDKEIAVRNIGICTPFNDNYPDAATCMNGRCNAHVWAGGKSAYVNAMRMGGIGPHLGLLVTDGSINDYEVWERGQNKGWSNVRGVLAMCPPDITLKPGETYSLEWRIFTHDGDNFDQKILERGGTIVKSDRYVYEKGDEAAIEFISKDKTDNIRKKLLNTGETKIEHNGNIATLLVIDNIDSLISRRADFIINRQQMRDKNDKRLGAFMVFDNEGDSILTNTGGRSDLDEGRERVGMGIFLARY